MKVTRWKPVPDWNILPVGFDMTPYSLVLLKEQGCAICRKVEAEEVRLTIDAVFVQTLQKLVDYSTGSLMIEQDYATLNYAKLLLAQLEDKLENGN